MQAEAVTAQAVTAAITRFALRCGFEQVIAGALLDTSTRTLRHLRRQSLRRWKPDLGRYPGKAVAFGFLR
jgi:hypothetical protein